MNKGDSDSIAVTLSLDQIVLEKQGPERLLEQIVCIGAFVFLFPAFPPPLPHPHPTPPGIDNTQSHLVLLVKQVGLFIC